MRRPVLFWHDYKSVTMVGMEVKSWENREGLRILCCFSKASGHLGASVFSLKSLWQHQDPWQLVTTPSRPSPQVLWEK